MHVHAWSPPLQIDIIHSFAARRITGLTDVPPLRCAVLCCLLCCAVPCYAVPWCAVCLAAAGRGVIICVKENRLASLPRP